MRRALPAIAFIVLAQPAAVSTTTVIDSKPSCARCTIELVKLFTLGGPNDTVAYHPYMFSVVADSKGTVYVGPTKDERIGAFSSEGKLLRTLGRKGGGPGEFSGLQYLAVGPGDTLYVFDHESRRANLFAPDYRYIRSSGEFGGQRHMPAVLRTGEIITMASPQKVGDSLIALHAASGKELRRYPPLVRQPREPDQDWNFVQLAPTSRGTVWVGHPNFYQIDEYELSGKISRALRRDLDWWSKPSEYTSFAPREKKPQPTLIAIREDEVGRLWTVVLTGKADWRQLDPPGTYLQKPTPQGERNRYFDAIVEVLDPATGKLITSRRFPFPLSQLRAGNIVVATHEDEDGNLLRDIYRIELRQR
jgi:hypothetical protein